ncbi:hypothetical protein ACFQZC_23675 [Streptacidiphilus monticola]
MDGSTEGAWFAFGLRTSSEPDYTRFFLWNTATAKLRQIPCPRRASPHAC